MFCLVCIAIKNGTIIPKEKEERKCFVLRCISNALCSVFCCVSLHYLPVFDGLAVFYFTLLAVSTTLASVILKEKLDAFTAFILLLLSAGIVLVSQPSFMFANSEDQSSPADLVIGYATMAISGCSHAISTLAIRRMPNTESVSITLYGGITTIVMASAYLHFEIGDIRPIEAQEYGLFVAAGFNYCFFILTEVAALKSLSVAKYQLFAFIDLPVGFVIDIFWFKIRHNTMSYVGASIIFLGILGNSCKVLLSEPKQESVCENDEERPLSEDIIRTE